MRRGRGEVDRVQVGGVYSAIARGMRQVGFARFAVVIGLVLAYTMNLCELGTVGTVPAFADACINAAVRTGPSATLPDCRAYEQVTPADKGDASQDMEHGGMTAYAAVDGERLGLETLATFGPSPQENGSFSVFSRTASEWKTTSVRPTDSGSAVYEGIQVVNPDLTQLAVQSATESPFSPDRTFQVGVPGGPFTTLAETPVEDEHPDAKRDRIVGASDDFSHVVFASVDHALLPIGPTGTDEEAYDLYEWPGGGACGSVTSDCKLINVNTEGNLLSKCGAALGDGEAYSQAHAFHDDLAHNAVSADGSRIFFTSPDPEGKGEGCPITNYERGPNPIRLYMSVTEMVGGHEQSRTVEMAKPAPGVKLSEEEETEFPVFYQAATADGSKVFFLTERALTPDAVRGYHHLYEYDTGVPEEQGLKLIFQSENGAEPYEEAVPTVFPSEDGSVVYFYWNESTTIYRYEAGAGPPQQIASAIFPESDEGPYSTPDGEFFMFASRGVAGEPRGVGRNEIYRYDHVDGSVMCVSCGPGAPPPTGEAYTGEAKDSINTTGTLALTPEFIPMSADGSEVFFDSSAALLPQVVNEGETPEGEPLINVYEWEADGAGGCTQSLGCTYLISQGNTQNSSYLIGASVEGNNVFFMTEAQLVPQDTDTANDIYDARVGGGFPAPTESAACLGDTCQSVPPALNDPTPASLSFSGPGNPVAVLTTVKARVKKGCGKGTVRRKGRCVKRRRARKGRKADRGAGERDRGGSR